MKSEKYPCIYGLREYCEAIEFAFEIVLGEYEKELSCLFQVSSEPKTDEERLIKRLIDAMKKFAPQIVFPHTERTIVGQVSDVIARFCQQCPYRLNAMNKYESAKLMR
jgi:hypothetical protein